MSVIEYKAAFVVVAAETSRRRPAAPLNSLLPAREPPKKDRKERQRKYIQYAITGVTSNAINVFMKERDGKWAVQKLHTYGRAM